MGFPLAVRGFCMLTRHPSTRGSTKCHPGLAWRLYKSGKQKFLLEGSSSSDPCVLLSLEAPLREGSGCREDHELAIPRTFLEVLQVNSFCILSESSCLGISDFWPRGCADQLTLISRVDDLERNADCSPNQHGTSKD